MKVIRFINLKSSIVNQKKFIRFMKFIRFINLKSKIVNQQSKINKVYNVYEFIKFI